jgi:hypothetical protein
MMSNIERLSICEMLKQKRIRIKQAAAQSGISHDQMLRIYKKFTA